MKYEGSIMIVDDEGNAVYERELTVEEMIDCLIAAAGNPPIVELKETASSARDSFREGIGKAAKRMRVGGKGEVHCSKCGEPGHRATTCGRAKMVNDQFDKEERDQDKKKQEKRQKAFEAGVARMVAVNCSFEEVKVAFPKKTDRELEEAVANASAERNP